MRAGSVKVCDLGSKKRYSSLTGLLLHAVQTDVICHSRVIPLPGLPLAQRWCDSWLSRFWALPRQKGDPRKNTGSFLAGSADSQRGQATASVPL